MCHLPDLGIFLMRLRGEVHDILIVAISEKYFFVYDVREAENRRKVSRDEGVLQWWWVADWGTKRYVID